MYKCSFARWSVRIATFIEAIAGVNLVHFVAPFVGAFVGPFAGGFAGAFAGGLEGCCGLAGGLFCGFREAGGL